MSAITARCLSVHEQAVANGQLNEHGQYPVGKYEGETPLTLALHQLALERKSHCETGNYPDGLYMAGFRLTDEESDFLKVKPFVVIAAHTQRYAILLQFTTAAEYQAELDSASEPNADDVPENE